MIEFLLVCAFIVIMIALNSYYRKTTTRISDVDTSLSHLRRELKDLHQHILDREQREVPSTSYMPPPVIVPEPPAEIVVQPIIEPVIQELIEELPEIEPSPAPPVSDPAEKTLTVEDINAFFDTPHDPITEPADEVADTAPIRGSITEELPPPAGKPFKTIATEEVDYEKYIGENLISKIGIAILVLAIGFFVKFAIDNNWINEVGRVCIGLACGGILVGLAHRLRTDYKAFSSVLVGGGIAVFYFTIALAYHQFHLFDQTTSFVIMVVITIFAVVLSLLYDRQELAVISMVGGYATPFMVSNGSGNYIALFSYLCVLNTGLLAIAYMRIWRVLNVLAFAFTIIIFCSWLFTLGVGMPPEIYRNAFIFATVFFLFFFTACLAHNIKEKKKFLPFDFSMLLVNSVWYFSIGLYLLIGMHAPEYKGLFSACMAGFHLVISYLLFRNQKADSNILYLLIGITLTFISITAPLQLEGSFITLFWASEAVLLLWLYQRSRMPIIALGSTIVAVISLGSLLLNWSQSYSDSLSQSHMMIIINKPFITSIYTALCFLAIYALRSRKNAEDESTDMSWLIPRPFFIIAAVGVAFLIGCLEISYQFGERVQGVQISIVYLMLYLIVFALATLLGIKRFTQLTITSRTSIRVYAALVGIYMLHLPVAYGILNDLLLLNKYTGLFAAHWITAVMVIALIWRATQDIVEIEGIDADVRSLISWVISGTIVIFLSTESYLMAISLFYQSGLAEGEITRIFIKAFLPILWGLCSFAFMWVGMKRSYRQLRIISLVLFAFTLLKLFLFDISNVPIAGKIAAFFCLGVLLLVVSFMYQRLKKILIDEKKEE